MRILFLAAEAAPLAAVTGLGEMAGSLATALAGLGHDVRVAIPFSGVIDRKRFAPQTVARFVVPHTGGDQLARVSEVREGGVTFYLIAGPPIPRVKRVYGGIDEDAPKFIFTSLAALGLCRALAWAPDLVHGFDSASGPAMYWLDTDGLHDLLFQPAASVLTLHNVEGANAGAAPSLHAYGLTASDAPLLPDWARASLLGLGLAHAAMLSVPDLACVDATLTSAPGDGLDDLLAARRERLARVRRGLDLAFWNPRTDPRLAARYDEVRLNRRAANKRALQKALGLPLAPRAPLIGVVAQARQPGLDVTVPALRRLLAGSSAVQVSVRGNTPPAIDAGFGALAAEHPTRVRLSPAFDAALTGLFYAGCDLLLAPACCQPSDPAPLIALRYGAVPVVRANGGLAASTVIDYAEARRGTGFVVTDYNEKSLLNVLRRALGVYTRPARWQALQRRGMRQALEFSWSHSADIYLALYQQAIHYRKEAVTTLTQRLADVSTADFSESAGSRVAGAGQAMHP